MWEALTEIELPFLHVLQDLATPWTDVFWTFMTGFGEAGIFWIVLTLALLLFPKTRKAGFTMALALLMGAIVGNGMMKPLIARPRPYDFDLTLAHRLAWGTMSTDFSFPSGHTLASFEAATVLMIRNKKLGVPALVLAVLIAFSRLYLYVHYPTDVLVSVVLGIGIAFLGNFLVEKGFSLWENRKLKA